MSNSFLYRKVLTPRRLMIDYQAPPICEGDFTSTGTVTISLQPILRPGGPTGLVMNWDGTRWWLTWNVYPGALCYSIYRLGDVLDPFSEWVLVAECISGTNFPLPVDGIYGITVITLDGESEPSDPIPTPTIDPGNPPPPWTPPEEPTCDPETGPECPYDLMIAEDTPLGDIVPDPTLVTYTESWGTFDEGQYEVSYLGGAWYDERNPNPFEWKIGFNKLLWDGGGNEFQLIFYDYYVSNPTSQAAAEAEYAALVAALEAWDVFDFIHLGGTIGIEQNAAVAMDPADNYSPGAPNPTYRLRRTGTWPVHPARLRIQGYDVNSWGDGSGCDAIGSGGDPWDGTLDTKYRWLPYVFQWTSSVALSATIHGKTIAEVKCHWGFHPTTSHGNGWEFYINFYNNDGVVDAWTGYKGVGTSPVGRYYRASGCLTGPPCLVLESY